MKTAIDPSQSEAAPSPPVLAGTAKWVVFSLDAGRYALPLATVERIVRAVEVTRLPSAPPIILGAIDVQGRVLPVFNIRRRFGLPERDIGPSDHFLIARSADRSVVTKWSPSIKATKITKLTGTLATTNGVTFTEGS